MIWSESRPGWIAALWACILEGIALVPIDPQASLSLFHRIRQKVEPQLILRGDRVPAFESEVEAGARVWLVAEIEDAPGEPAPESASLTGDDIAEVVFTSGTTAEPKGVVITHRNLAANLRPIGDQFGPYLKYVLPFAPLRILNLLPMSHLFGQTLATFVPPLIPASVVFISSTSPQEISRQIRRRHVSVLVSVPRVLEVLRRYIVHRFPVANGAENAVDQTWPVRCWRYREVHRLLGWKFCCLVAGGAPLPPDLEAFWTGLGYIVVQGSCRAMGADFVVGSDVWEISSLLRGFGIDPHHPRASLTYPSHYHSAVCNTDLLICPKVPLAGYLPGPEAIERMISAGEDATRLALSRFTAQAA